MESSSKIAVAAPMGGGGQRRGQTRLCELRATPTMSSFRCFRQSGGRYSRPAMQEVETALERHLRSREFDQAATLALEAYGPEVFGFLVNVLGGATEAEDVFGQFVEDLWCGLTSFGFRASFRTWLYTLARHAAVRFRRSPWNRRDRRTGSSHLDGLAARARSRTQPYLRSEVKDQLRALRDSLDVEDRMLLVLRLDRNLSWQEIAVVSLEDGGEVDAEALRRESARLRKRFQLLKDELRARARAAGLLAD